MYYLKGKNRDNISGVQRPSVVCVCVSLRVTALESVGEFHPNTAFQAAERGPEWTRDSPHRYAPTRPAGRQGHALPLARRSVTQWGRAEVTPSRRPRQYVLEHRVGMFNKIWLSPFGYSGPVRSDAFWTKMQNELILEFLDSCFKFIR